MSKDTQLQLRVSHELKDKLQHMADTRYMNMTGIVMMALHQTYPELSRGNTEPQEPRMPKEVAAQKLAQVFVDAGAVDNRPSIRQKDAARLKPQVTSFQKDIKPLKKGNTK